MKGKITFILIGLIIVAGIVAAVLIIVSNNAKEAALNGPCGTNKVEASSKQIQNLLSQWSDSEDIAGSTPRIALSGPISNMQNIKRQFDALEVPDCMKSATYYYKKAMDDALKAHLAFMSQDDDATITSYFKSASAAMGQGNNALQAVFSCAPDCP